MQDTDLKAERLAKMSELGVALSELAGQLKRRNSAYHFIDPDEEPAYVDLWKGLIDLEHVLANYCHDMPPAAEKHARKVTGEVRIPMVSMEELMIGYDVRKIPWHHARRLRNHGTKKYTVKSLEGGAHDVIVTVEKTRLTRPVPIPEGESLAYTPVEPVGFHYVFRTENGKGEGGETVAVDLTKNTTFALPLLGLESVRILHAADGSLAPEISRDDELLLDTTVKSYDGAGFYAFESPDGNTLEIAEVKPAPEGGFLYTADREVPAKRVDDPAKLPWCGKFRYRLEEVEENSRSGECRFAMDHEL